MSDISGFLVADIELPREILVIVDKELEHKETVFLRGYHSHMEYVSDVRNKRQGIHTKWRV